MFQKQVKSNSYTGEVSLIIWIFFASFMGVIIRYLDAFFGIFQQVFLRSFLAFFLSFVIYFIFFGKLDFSKIDKRDVGILAVRSLLHLLGVFLWILAITNTTLANATLISSIPATAILGIIFFSDRLTFRSWLYLLVSLLGAVIISFDTHFEIGIGEIYALMATFFFSGYSMIRKKLSNKIGDREISTLSILITSIYAFISILIWEKDFSKFFTEYSHISIFYLFLGAVVFLGISFFGTYGFKRVNSIKASSIEYLEIFFAIFFAILLGFLFFSEIPNLKDVLGGSLIVLGAYLMLKTKQ